MLALSFTIAVNYTSYVNCFLVQLCCACFCSLLYIDGARCFDYWPKNSYSRVGGRARTMPHEHCRPHPESSLFSDRFRSNHQHVAGWKLLLLLKCCGILWYMACRLCKYTNVAKVCNIVLTINIIRRIISS